MLCLAFCTAVHLGVMAILLPVIIAHITDHKNICCNVTHTIKKPPVPEIHNFPYSSRPLFVIVAIRLRTSEGWKPEFGLHVPVPAVAPRSSWKVMHE